MGNYFDNKAAFSRLRITEDDRNTAVKRILWLCKEKGYKAETHFLAVNIFDKFLSYVLSSA